MGGLKMSQEWMIDVLVDLRQYALKNYYVALAEQLDDAIVVAATELRANECANDDMSEQQSCAVISL